MFCQKCGFQMADDSRFCPQCATPVAGVAYMPTAQQVYDYQAEKRAIRDSEEMVATAAYNHFAQKQAAFDEYDRVISDITRYKRSSFKALIVWGCILLTLPALLFLPVVLEDAEFIAVALMTMLPGIAMLAGGISKAVRIRRNIAAFEKRYAELSVELYNHYLDCPNCPVGPEYINPKALYKIITVLRSGRADTIKESINVMVTDANSARLGNYLRQLQATTNQINAQTNVAAVFAAGSFFLR